MKQILKIVIGLLAGATIGFLGASVGVVLVKGITFEQYFSKFAGLDIGTWIGIPLLSIALVYVAGMLQIILHEAGHLVCGLASGYRFVSFRILSLTLIRQKGKLRIKRYNLAGTGGQCLLTPPDRPVEDVPTFWYNAGGVLTNLLTSLAAIAVLSMTEERPFAWTLFLLFFLCIGIFFTLINGIPSKMNDIGNDAYNLCLLRKHPDSKRALVLQLRINALIQAGTRPKDMPEEWFPSPTDATDYSNALGLSLHLMAISRLQEQNEWETAYTCLEEAYAHRNEMLTIYTREVECELLFTALVTGRTARARTLYTDELQKYIRLYSKISSSKQRQLFAVALYIEGDEAKARDIYLNVLARRPHYLMQGEVAMDLAIMKQLLQSFA